MGRRVLVTILVFVLCGASRAQEWGYESPIGPNDWSGISSVYSECGDGTMQSPINILTDDSTVDDISGLFFFQTNSSRTGTLANDGHTVTFVAENPNDLAAPSINIVSENAFFSGRMTGDLYHLNNVDFHWGSTDAQGSEHSINGMRTAGEVHFIYFNREYNTFENASGQSDGLIIIALRLDVCAYSDFDTIFGSNNEHLSMLSDNSSSIATGINWRLDDLHECEDFRFGVCREPFYVYFGSLTTPACEQSVLWWVSADNLCITSQQLDLLRSQRVSVDGPLLVNNFRPLQGANGRGVLLTGESSQVSYELFKANSNRETLWFLNLIS